MRKVEAADAEDFRAEAFELKQPLLETLRGIADVADAPFDPDIARYLTFTRFVCFAARG